MRKQKWRNFTEAREFVRALKLSSMDGYRKYCKSGKKPKDIPTGPNIAYKKEWISFGDWLGNGVVAYKYKTWRPFEDAKHFAILLKLQSFEEWKKYCKSGNKPDDIPDIPSNIYKNKGWISWPDFLGNKRIVKYTKSNTMPFEECKKFVRNLGVTTGSEWFRWCKKNKKPDNIPYNPDEVYKEWTTWGDFLGPLPEKWKSFEDARKFAHSLKLKNPGEWNKFSKLGKRPEDIPAGPRGVYKEDWIGWSDFLGTGNLNSQQLQEQYISYDDAKKYVQKQGIKTVPKFNEWSSQGKRPLFIPAKPQKFYKEWIDWDDFFGRDKKIIISFEDARKFARSLNLTYRSEWFELYDKGKLPKDLPKYVNERYPDQGWNGWSDFLGSTAALSGLQRNKQMRSYEECKKFVRNLGIKTETQWREWNDNDNNQRPVDIPYSFQKSYPNEWKKNGGMGGFLGTGRIADKNKVWMSFEKARTIVQKLGLKNMDEYKKELNAGKIPKNIPANPNKVYQNKGWESNGDWLGTGTISNRKKSQAFLSAKEAKPVLKKLFKEYDIKNLSDWREFSKTHIKLLEELHIPSKLLRTYSLKNANRKSKK